jgi:type II secretory pathway pseudopilin PulG
MERRAYSLVEILVVATVLALLSGLVLPVLQRIREAAARTKCVNNLKQLNLSIHGYICTNDHWPGSGTVYSANDGWLVQTAPFRETSDAVVVCPAKPRNKGWVVAATDYASVVSGDIHGGVGGSVIPTNYHYDSLIVRNGTVDYPTRVGHSGRGLSNTLAIGHVWQSVEYYGTSGNYHGGWNTGHEIVTVKTTAYAPHPDGPNTAGWDSSFGGPHSGVVMGLGDGSIRILTWEVDFAAWKEMGGR